jgi:hypothetical protein
LLSVDTTIAGRKQSRTAVAAGALLDTWTAHSWNEGIRVDCLGALDRLTVTTRHSTYEIIVLAHGSSEVMVRGGDFFPEFTRARVSGSSLGGSFLKLHTVHVGFRMELADGTRSIVTSPVRDISLTTEVGFATQVM